MGAKSALSSMIASSFLSCSERDSEQILEFRSALERPQHDLDGGVHLATTAYCCVECASIGCTTMLLHQRVCGLLPCSGSVSRRILARKGALDAPLQGHDDGVCCVAAAQVSGEMSRPSEVTKWQNKIDELKIDTAGGMFN